MDILLNVVLPLSLAFIMFALGTSLTWADFARVATAPKAFFMGVMAQVIFLPVVAFLLLQVFPLSAALAVGVMILSACPGGVTSNILARLAGGTVALSVSLTAVISLLSVVTVPIIVVWAAQHFQGADAPDIDVTTIGITMFAITMVPVIIGMVLRVLMPGAIGAAEPWFFRIATVLFVIIVAAALGSNWQTFIDNLPVLGPVLIVLNIVMLALGFGISRVVGLSSPDARAISVEAGVQNSTLGITVAALISGNALGDYALPAGVYGITMYLVTLPLIYLLLRRI